MSDSTTNTGKYWLMFLVSLAATVLMLMFIPQWFWVALPFLLTGFVKGMDWI